MFYSTYFDFPIFVQPVCVCVCVSRCICYILSTKIFILHGFAGPDHIKGLFMDKDTVWF